MKLSYAGCSQRGQVRPRNEDAYLMRLPPLGSLYLVADGLGGRAHGSLVSGMLRDGYDRWFQDWVRPGPPLDLPTAIAGVKEVLLEQNEAVIRRFGPQTAGSTLALLLLLPEGCLYLSSGDSRIYRGRALSVTQLTVDDTYENWAGPAGLRDPAARGRLVRAVGIHPEPQFTMGTGALRQGDWFFLCSDGVYRSMSARALNARLCLGSSCPRRLVAGLSRAVEGSGAGDNYSMIVARVCAR